MILTIYIYLLALQFGAVYMYLLILYHNKKVPLLDTVLVVLVLMSTSILMSSLPPPFGVTP